jgi:2,5-diketo-D-gluconate reductase B
VSLKRLGLASVDLVLLHWPSPTRSVEDSVAALGEPLERGLTRLVGVSNFPVAYLERAAAVAPIACNQVELHPYLSQKRLRRRAAELGIAIVAYSPLARGRVVRDPVLSVIGSRHRKSAAQVALRWLIQTPGVAAVPKASSRSRLVENLDVFDFELSESEMSAVDAPSRHLRLLDPPFAPPWDEDE